MDETSVETFFSLENYEHKRLFDRSKNVWDPLFRLREYFEKSSLENIEVKIPDSAHLINKEYISIGKGTIVEPGACICGPCIIGQGCEIRHGAYVRGYVVTGDRCVIGHATEIKNSILLNGARAPHFNYVGDSILGNDTNLGAGVVCANLRFDRKSVRVTFKGNKIETLLKKFGAIIGDGAQIGCHCVTNPGTLIGKGVFCDPCLNLSGYISPFSKIKKE